MKLSKIKAPNTLLIISSILLFTAVLTWIIPGGEYERIEKDGREQVISGSYKVTEQNPQGFGDLLMAPIRGFQDAALIIGFVLIVGGAFSVFQKTEAVDSAIKGIAEAHRKSRLIKAVLIPLLMIIFSLAGAIFGMSEEVIPFVLIFIPMALMLGYDSIVGIAIPFVGAGAGFAAAFLNPFTVGIAQGIAGIPLFSGIEYRFVSWLICTAVAIIFVSRYARRIKKNPHKSITYELDVLKKKSIHETESSTFKGLTVVHKRVILIFITAMLVLVYGVLQFHWYIEEISALFLITGIIVGLAGKLKLSELTEAFVSGAKEMISTALVIGLARGILIIAEEGKVIDTILNYLSSPISDMHPIVSSQFMFFVQSSINFFVPSGSGQAVLTMPVMAPLADLAGISRQTAVLAFQFGDGFSNLIIPTSAVTMSILTLAEVPWEKWARWILPLEIIFFIIALILLIPPHYIGW